MTDIEKLNNVILELEEQRGWALARCAMLRVELASRDKELVDLKEKNDSRVE